MVLSATEILPNESMKNEEQINEFNWLIATLRLGGRFLNHSTVH